MLTSVRQPEMVTSTNVVRMRIGTSRTVGAIVATLAKSVGDLPANTHALGERGYGNPFNFLMTHSAISKMQNAAKISQ